MSASRAISGALVVAGLAGFFVWVLVEMATANDGMWRLVKLSVGILGVTAAAALIYLVLWPLGRRSDDDGPASRS